MSDAQNWRDKNIVEEFPRIYSLIYGTILIAIGVAIGYVVLADQDGYLTNLFTEAISIAVTVFVLNILAEQREERRERERLKRDLIYQLGGYINEDTVRAARTLRRHDWLSDGSLNGQDFQHASLENAYLAEADFTKANMWGAFLTRASLERAKLNRANLGSVDFSLASVIYAQLIDADLTSASFSFAEVTCSDLRGANLTFADLRGARLLGANLGGTNFTNASFNNETILPDGTHWSPNADMARFTDPAHPDFWRSDDPISPAYRASTPDD